MTRTQIPEHLITRHAGMPVHKQVWLGLLINMLGSGFILAIAYGIANELVSVIPAFIGGVVCGVFPLGFIFILLIRKVQLKPASLICLGFQAFGVLIAVMFDHLAFYTASVLIYAWTGFIVGFFIAMIWGPRHRIYRYATCPGCKYNLEQLPKALVCPECGRDNTDLVKMFADFGIKKSDLSAAP